MKPLKIDNIDKNEIAESIDTFVEKIRKSIINQIESGKTDIKIKEDMVIQSKDDFIRPCVVFTTQAYSKIMYMVAKNKKECGWYGTVDRLENNVFQVTDIVVYPQIVSTATVETDQKKHDEFMLNLDDETFNHLKLHGHSHVNMSVSPSGVDINFRKDVLKTIPENSFYIFMVVNKNMDIEFEIYDKETNILYEDKDIYWNVVFENGDLVSFEDDMKTKITNSYAKTNIDKSTEDLMFFGNREHGFANDKLNYPLLYTEGYE